jgi:hypothetical protein
LPSIAQVLINIIKKVSWFPIVQRYIKRELSCSSNKEHITIV